MPCCHVHASMQIISQGHTVDLTGRTVPDVICSVEDCPYCQLQTPLFLAIHAC